VVRPHNLRRPYYEPLVWFMIIAYIEYSIASMKQAKCYAFSNSNLSNSFWVRCLEVQNKMKQLVTKETV